MQVPPAYAGREHTFLKHRVLQLYVTAWAHKLGSLGRKGRVTEPLEELLGHAAPGSLHLYACGPNPMLAAVKIWAFAHLLANGMLADLLLFGGFLIWAVADRISVKRRAVVRPVPGPPPGKINDLIAVVGGLALYVVFVFWLHTWLIGVPPLAM